MLSPCNIVRFRKFLLLLPCALLNRGGFANARPEKDLLARIGTVEG